MKLFIYLNSEGDRFTVKHADLTVLSEAESKKLHPVIHQILSAEGHESVAAALRALQQLAKQDTTTPTSFFFENNQEIKRYNDFIIPLDENNDEISFSLMHHRAPYVGHQQIKGQAHYDSFETLIDFVEGKNRTADNSSPFTPTCTIS